MKLLLLSLCFSACIAAASDITLKDGRLLQSATIIGQDAATVTIRHSSGIVKARKEMLPDEIASLFNAQGDAPQSQAVGQSSNTNTDDRPKGSSVYVDGIQMREIKRSGNYVYYSWVAKTGNPTDSTAVLRADITLYDSTGFKLGSALGDKTPVRSGTFAALTGDGMIELSLWQQVSRYEVILDNQ